MQPVTASGRAPPVAAVCVRWTHEAIAQRADPPGAPPHGRAMPSPTAGMSFARLAVEDDMKIAQLMTKDVLPCRQSDMLDAAVRSMWDCDIGSLPVIDDSGQLVGMV